MEVFVNLVFFLQFMVIEVVFFFVSFVCWDCPFVFYQRKKNCLGFFFFCLKVFKRKEEKKVGEKKKWFEV